jgi:serine/threonine protein kinase
MIPDDADDRMQKDFLGEAQLLAKFGTHPNVMGLLKVVRQSKPLLVILSFMPHGDLRNYLRK